MRPPQGSLEAQRPPIPLRFPLTLSSPVGPLSQLSVRSAVVTCLRVSREGAVRHLMKRVWPSLLPLRPRGLEAAAVGGGEPRGGGGRVPSCGWNAIRVGTDFYRLAACIHT